MKTDSFSGIFNKRCSLKCSSMSYHGDQAWLKESHFRDTDNKTTVGTVGITVGLFVLVQSQLHRARTSVWKMRLVQLLVERKCVLLVSHKSCQCIQKVILEWCHGAAGTEFSLLCVPNKNWHPCLLPHQEQQLVVCQMLQQQRQRELQRLTLSGALTATPNSPMIAQSPNLLSSATASPLQGGQGGSLFGLQDNALHKPGVSHAAPLLPEPPHKWEMRDHVWLFRLRERRAETRMGDVCFIHEQLTWRYRARTPAWRIAINVHDFWTSFPLSSLSHSLFYECITGWTSASSFSCFGILEVFLIGFFVCVGSFQRAWVQWSLLKLH